MNTIERVAKAIADSCEQNVGRFDVGIRVRLDGMYPLELVARAAIEALREPDEAMIEAALDVGLDIYWNYADNGGPGGPKDVWQAMLTTILNTDTGEG